jgi:hypothetical protein
MRPNLSSSSCTDEVFDSLPILAKESDGLQKPIVLFVSPSACLNTLFTLFTALCHNVTITSCLQSLRQITPNPFPIIHQVLQPVAFDSEFNVFTA